VTLNSVPLYLGAVEETMARLAPDECLRREARRIDRVFRMKPPLDPETRAEIALHEWVRAGRRVTPAMVRRAKRAILTVGAWVVVHGLADSWKGVKRAPARLAPAVAI
jgi:hypothetical protein